MSNQYEVIQGDEEEIEISFSQPDDGVNAADELAKERERREALEKEREDLKTRADLGGALGSVAEMVAKQKQDEQRRLEEARRQAQGQATQFGIPENDPLFEELEERFLKSPAKAFAWFTQKLQERVVMPVGSYLAGQVQEVRGETRKQTLLQDDINRETYSRYRDEVDQVLMEMGPVNEKTVERAMELVRGRHINEMAEWINEKKQAAGTAAPVEQQQAAATKAGNRSPGTVGGPTPVPAGTKKTIYVKPELMAQKPRGMNDRDWVEYLQDKGLVK